MSLKIIVDIHEPNLKKEIVIPTNSDRLQRAINISNATIRGKKKKFVYKSDCYNPKDYR